MPLEEGSQAQNITMETRMDVRLRGPHTVAAGPGVLLYRRIEPRGMHGT